MSIALLLIVPLLLTVLLFWLCLRFLGNLSWVVGWLRGNVGLLLLVLTLFGGLLSWDLLSFQPVNSPKQFLGTVSFRESSPRSWQVQLTGQGNITTEGTLVGGLWSLKAQLFEMSVSKYQRDYLRVDSLNGRFLRLEQALKQENEALVVHHPLYIDSWSTLNWAGQLKYLETAVVHSQAVPMVDGGIFEIWFEQGSFVVNPVNGPAIDVLGRRADNLL